MLIPGGEHKGEEMLVAVTRKHRAHCSREGTGGKEQNKNQVRSGSKLQPTLRTSEREPRGEEFKGKGVQENRQVSEPD